SIVARHQPGRPDGPGVCHRHLDRGLHLDAAHGEGDAVSALVTWLQRGSFELPLAAVTGMVCVMALIGGIRSLFGGKDAIAERLERVRRDGGGQAFAPSAPRPEVGAGAATRLLAGVLRPLARLV